LAVAAVVSGWSAWSDILGVGTNDPEQSHILLAIPIALWLGWARRDRLRIAGPSWSPLGPVLIGAAWYLGELGLSRSLDVLWHLSAVLLVIGAILTIAGPVLVVRFAVPLVALLALVPIPGLIRQEIATPLQEISARCTQFLLDTVGIPVMRSGNVLEINGVPVAVAEACNGMRMVAALGLVTYLFVFVIPAKAMARAVLLALSPVLAVVVNIVRLVPTVLFYGYSSKPTAELFHDLSGWLMLVVAFGLLWAFIWLLRWLEFPVLNYGALRD
jgi:exosortase